MNSPPVCITKTEVVGVPRCFEPRQKSREFRYVIAGEWVKVAKGHGEPMADYRNVIRDIIERLGYVAPAAHVVFRCDFEEWKLSTKYAAFYEFEQFVEEIPRIDAHEGTRRAGGDTGGPSGSAAARRRAG